MTVFSILAESRRRWWELGSSCGCTEVSAFPREQGDGIHGTHWFVQFLSQLQNSVSCMCGGLGLYLCSAAGIQEPWSDFSYCFKGGVLESRKQRCQTSVWIWASLLCICWIWSVCVSLQVHLTRFCGPLRNGVSSVVAGNNISAS